MECDSCGGKGWWPLDPEDPEKYDEVNCEECNGTGIIKSHTKETQ